MLRVGDQVQSVGDQVLFVEDQVLSVRDEVLPAWDLVLSERDHGHLEYCFVQDLIMAVSMPSWRYCKTLRAWYPGGLRPWMKDLNVDRQAVLSPGSFER